jgi:chemotaxis-related protein WspD
MSGRPEGTGVVMHDCWNRVGVRGDRSCPELATYAHCRNCPVHAAGATKRLDAEPPAGYLAERTRHFAERAGPKDTDARVAFLFRVASEWLALPMWVVAEVTQVPVMHSLPHRRNGVVLGIASVRAQLTVCVSLAKLLGVQPADAQPERRKTAYRRLIVMRRDDVRAACPVDDVHGIHRYSPKELRDVPATVARASATYSTAVLSWQGHTVGVLDEDLLFYTLKRSLG